MTAPTVPTAEAVADVRQTTCCVVGGGPAGMVLSLLLARQGVAVTLLEAHHDFERDFRGDTIHPSTLEMLDQIGLAERLHRLAHGQMRELQLHASGQAYTLADLRRLRTKFPYVMMLPQAQFLEFLADEAKKYPSFTLTLGANVQRLVEEEGAVRGVRYRDAADHWHEVRAALTVGADGRFSRVRRLLGWEPVKTSPPMDVLWLRLPRRAADPADVGAIYAGGGHFVVTLERPDEWQLGYVILKGSYQQARAAGLDELRRGIAALVPWLADRVELLRDWKQVTVLSVESSRLRRWYGPGVLLIGDAAHTMSPVGGVGINYAVQDAVEAANLLAGPLLRGRVRLQDLAAVQRRRLWPVRVIQAVQALAQKQLAAPALTRGRSFRVPLPLRLLLRTPGLRNLPGRMIGWGVRPAYVKNP